MTIVLRDGTKIEAVAEICPHSLGDTVMLFLYDVDGRKIIPFQNVADVEKIEA
ncbi:hypothetical protein LCGC14_1041190 [marine sediment metagenome]|uniref:Uncharacterized protein n=1 Tax=marine sediment metagenome TaxID=412755 RepID=A0A0F9Q9W7_9ZZZZ